MATRTAFHQPSFPHTRHSPSPFIRSGPASPRSSTPTTPTRIHAPRARSTLATDMPAEPDAARENTTPRRRVRRGTRGRSRNNTSHKAESGLATPDADGSDAYTPGEPDTDTGDEDAQLFELLGVSPTHDASPAATNDADGDDANNDSSPSQAQEKGLLRLSKQDMAAATNKKKRQRTKNKPRTDAAPRSETADTGGSENEPVDSTPVKPKRKPKLAQATTAGSAFETASDSSFDMGAMSRSLPPSFFSGAGAKDQERKTKAERSDVWDTPTDVPASTGGQQLTWQQLQADETPSKRAPRAAPDARRRSKAVAATAAAPKPNNANHDRRVSLDTHAPTSNAASNLTKMMTSSMPTIPTRNNMATAVPAPVSAFDSSIPFHTGFNVHRAPQTPVRTAAARASPVPAGPAGAISLPIVGEFPRINKNHSVAGPKYAGPTFHNSPASGALPKPDLDDF